MKCLSALMLCAVVAGTGTAKAADIYTRYFAGVNAGKPCYARYYDTAHLKAHPRQTVRRIEVDFDAGWRDDGGKNRAADFEAGIGFMLKRSGEWYGQELHCKVAGNGFACDLEADGGSIRLIPHGDALRLEVAGRGVIAAEGAKDFAEFGGPKGDDNVFILPRAERKLCDAASPK